MRQIIYCMLLVVIWLCSMATIIFVLSFGGIWLVLFAGAVFAAISTVALAEEFVEWRSRRKGKAADTLPVQSLPPAVKWIADRRAQR
jgi:hypothetical protein